MKELKLEIFYEDMLLFMFLQVNCTNIFVYILLQMRLQLTNARSQKYTDVSRSRASFSSWTTEELSWITEDTFRAAETRERSRSTMWTQENTAGESRIKIKRNCSYFNSYFMLLAGEITNVLL